jgi:GT2 family glycosyltransferase
VRIGVVVLHYRFWPGVIETLDALAQQDHPIERIVVVDNCSADGSAAQLRDRPGIDLVEATVNDGYAAGMNLGIRTLAPEHVDAVLLLTHEAVLSLEGLSALANELDADPELGAVGPLLTWRNNPDRVYSAGVSIDPRSWSTHHVGATDPVRTWRERGPQPVDSLDGAAVLIRREAIESTGQFNENYFMYFEEADYFVRMRRRGWAVACVPAALAVQQPGVPPHALWVRNSLRFRADNAPRRVLAREVLRTLYLAVAAAAHGRFMEARDGVAGLYGFLLRRPARAMLSYDARVKRS